jgi:hypothetical protein
MVKPPRPTLTTKHYAAIGHVVVQWAKLENRLISILQCLLDISKADALVTFWHAGYYEKRDRLHALFLLDEPDERLKKRFESLIGRMDTAFEFRNTIAHSVWQKKRYRTIQPFQMNVRHGKIKFTGNGIKPISLSANDILGEAETIKRLFEDVCQFFLSNYGFDLDVPPAKPNKRRMIARRSGRQ